MFGTELNVHLIRNGPYSPQPASGKYLLRSLTAYANGRREPRKNYRILAPSV